jgi:hypothetical protein
MTAIEQPAGTTHYIGFCDECHAAKTFTTARSRELWEVVSHPRRSQTS